MAYAMTFKPDFLERCKRMSGLKSNAAFAGAIGVSESVLSKAMHTNIVSPTMIVGFNRAFGFTPGEIAEVTEIPDKFAVLDFGYLYVVLLDTQFAGTQRKGDYINQEGKEGNASRQIVAVTDVPGFLFKFYIHNAIFYILFFYFSDTPFRSTSE